MDYKIKIYDIFEFGQRKDKEGNPHQEDCIYPLPGKATADDRLFILCDGMGGHDAGEVASQTVCEEMSKSALQNHEQDQEKVFDAALDAAFRGLDAKDTQAVKKMGTTMTYLRLAPQGAFVAHMGDSRVYHIRPGKDGASTEILYKTYDHSLVNDLVRIGELTPEEAKVSPRRNVITRAMQPHMERRPRADKKEITDLKSGDYFYMCSDGMLEEMEDDRIKEIFSAAGGDDPQKVQILLEETKDNKDNHSAIIVHILDVEGAQEDKESAFEIAIDDVKEPVKKEDEAPILVSGELPSHDQVAAPKPVAAPAPMVAPKPVASAPVSTPRPPMSAPKPMAARVPMGNAQPNPMQPMRHAPATMPAGKFGPSQRNNKLTLLTIIAIFVLAILLLVIFMVIKK